ncbi:putative Chitinase [Vibrio coralliirubri]|nr:putative Chitinase [Vibrio coralliirubri]
MLPFFITSGVLFANDAFAEIGAVQGVSNTQEMPIDDFHIEVIDWFVSADQEQLQEVCLYKSDDWEARPVMTAENALVCEFGTDIMLVDETGAGKVTLTVPESQLTENETFYLFATARDGFNTHFEYSPSADWAWFKAIASDQEDGEDSADFNYETSVNGLTKKKSAADSSPITKNSRNTLKTGGYLSDWAQYERQFKVSDIASSSYDEIIYSFFGICGDRATAGGTVGSTEKSRLVQQSCESLGKPEGAAVSLDHWGSFQTAEAFDPGYEQSDLYEGQLNPEKWQRLNAGNVRGLFGELVKLKVENPQVDIGLSIGGWTLSEPYHRVSASSELSQNFADSLIELLNKFTVGNSPLFTSLDIDWEFPGHGGESGAFTPEDGDNFVSLLRVIRNTLDDNGYQDIQLSSAVGATTTYIEAIGKDNYEALGSSEGLLDKIYLMNYDYWGSFDTGLGHQSNLLGQSVAANSPTGVNSADKAIRLLTSYGVDKSKIMLGVANYARGKQGTILVDGRPFEATNITEANVFGTYEETVVEGYDLFGNMAGQDLRGDNGFHLYTDYDNNADYYYNNNTGVYYSMDTPRTAAMKAKYAKDNELRGTFVWTIEQDYKGITIDSMNKVYGHELSGSNSFSPAQIQSFIETCGVNLSESECTVLKNIHFPEDNEGCIVSLLNQDVYCLPVGKRSGYTLPQNIVGHPVMVFSGKNAAVMLSDWSNLSYNRLATFSGNKTQEELKGVKARNGQILDFSTPRSMRVVNDERRPHKEGTACIITIDTNEEYCLKEGESSGYSLPPYVYNKKVRVVAPEGLAVMLSDWDNLSYNRLATFFGNKKNEELKEVEARNGQILDFSTPRSMRVVNDERRPHKDGTACIITIDTNEEYCLKAGESSGYSLPPYAYNKKVRVVAPEGLAVMLSDWDNLSYNRLATFSGNKTNEELKGVEARNGQILDFSTPRSMRVVNN